MAIYKGKEGSRGKEREDCLASKTTAVDWKAMDRADIMKGIENKFSGSGLGSTSLARQLEKEVLRGTSAIPGHSTTY